MCGCDPSTGYLCHSHKCPENGCGRRKDGDQLRCRRCAHTKLALSLSRPAKGTDG